MACVVVLPSRLCQTSLAVYLLRPFIRGSPPLVDVLQLVLKISTNRIFRCTAVLVRLFLRVQGSGRVNISQRKKHGRKGQYRHRHSGQSCKQRMASTRSPHPPGNTYRDGAYRFTRQPMPKFIGRLSFLWRGLLLFLYRGQ